MHTRSPAPPAARRAPNTRPKAPGESVAAATTIIRHKPRPPRRLCRGQPCATPSPSAGLRTPRPRGRGEPRLLPALRDRRGGRASGQRGAAPAHAGQARPPAATARTRSRPRPASTARHTLLKPLGGGARLRAGPPRVEGLAMEPEVYAARRAMPRSASSPSAGAASMHAHAAAPLLMRLPRSLPPAAEI